MRKNYTYAQTSIRTLAHTPIRTDAQNTMRILSHKNLCAYHLCA